MTGSVIAIYDIIMAISAPKVNLSELHSSLSNVIKTANFTNLPVDKTYVPPMITGNALHHYIIAISNQSLSR